MWKPNWCKVLGGAFVSPACSFFLFCKRFCPIIDLPEIIVAMMPCLFFDIHLLLTTIYSFSSLFFYRLCQMNMVLIQQVRRHAVAAQQKFVASKIAPRHLFLQLNCNGLRLTIQKTQPFLFFYSAFRNIPWRF